MKHKFKYARVFTVFLLLISFSFNNALALPLIRSTWSLGAFYGKQTDNTLGQLASGSMDLTSSKLYSIEAAREFSINSALGRFFMPVVSSVALAFNYTHQVENPKNLDQFTPMIILRWRRVFFTPVSLAFGEGASFSTRISARETRSDKDANDTKKLLNYLLFEASVSPINSLDFVLRLHHRSGMFGLYGARNNGATALQIGLRYYLG